MDWIDTLARIQRRRERSLLVFWFAVGFALGTPSPTLPFWLTAIAIGIYYIVQVLRFRAMLDAEEEKIEW